MIERREREGNMSDSSFYNTWRNNWVIERREREGNMSDISFYNTWRNNWVIKRREGGKHE